MAEERINKGGPEKPQERGKDQRKAFGSRGDDAMPGVGLRCDDACGHCYRDSSV